MHFPITVRLFSDQKFITKSYFEMVLSWQDGSHLYNNVMNTSSETMAFVEECTFYELDEAWIFGSKIIQIHLKDFNRMASKMV